MSTNIKIAIIAGALAIIAVISTVLIVNGGSVKSGLYVSSVTGNVYIDNAESGRRTAVSGEKLSKLDIITVESGGKLTVTYNISKKEDNNFTTFTERTQAIVSGDFEGGKSGEINLIRGTALVNNISNPKGFIHFRTQTGFYNTDNSAAVISFNIDDDFTYTICHNLTGKMSIQLYDMMGNTIGENEVLLSEKASKAILVNTTPAFETLNCDYTLDELDVQILKEMVNLTAFVDLPFSPEEIRTAIDNKPVEEEPAETDDDPIQTADTLTTVTEMPTVTLPETVTTQPPRETQATSINVITTAPVQTQAPAATTTTVATTVPTSDTTTVTTTNADEVYHTVTVDISGEKSTQYIHDGGDAILPENPTAVGYIFKGWDGITTNITADGTIRALFEESNCKVTLIIDNIRREITVPYGGDVTIPTDIILDNLVITGWDKPLTNITQDTTITAVFDKSDCIVTFNIDGTIYTQRVEQGGTAEPPYTPATNSVGALFTGWDRALTNITADTTITAIFASEFYTVTVNIDGVISTQTVAKGKDAILPESPTKAGYIFKGWDSTGKNITSNTTITALFEVSSSTYYTVTIDNGGQITSVLVMAGDTVSLPTPKEITGKVFVEWSHSGLNITSDLIITAIYRDA